MMRPQAARPRLMTQATAVPILNASRGRGAPEIQPSTVQFSFLKRAAKPHRASRGALRCRAASKSSPAHVARSLGATPRGEPGCPCRRRRITYSGRSRMHLGRPFVEIPGRTVRRRAPFACNQRSNSTRASRRVHSTTTDLLAQERPLSTHHRTLKSHPARPPTPAARPPARTLVTLSSHTAFNILPSQLINVCCDEGYI